MPELRRRHEQIGRRAKDRDRRKIPLHIEWQVRNERRVDREVSRRDDEQDAAVRRGAADGVDPDIAGAAGAVFDAGLLSGARLVFLSQKPAENIDRPAGRERQDQSDRALWEVNGHTRLCRRGARQCQHCGRRHQCSAAGDERFLRHGFSLLLEKRTARKEEVTTSDSHNWTIAPSQFSANEAPTSQVRP